MDAIYNPLLRSRPLFLLGFGVIVAYIPGVIGAAISTGWLFLFLTIPFLFLYCKPSFGFGFAFICYAIISLFWTENLNIAWFYLLQLTILACVFCLGQNIKEDQLKAIFKGLALGLGVSSIVAFFQYYGNHTVFSLNNSIAGLFINPNIYSEVSAVILVALVVLKLWWWIPVTLPGLLIVHSRTAILALGVGLLIGVWNYSKSLAIGLVLVVGVIGTYFYWGHFSVSSIQERFNLWADTIQGFKFFGNGIGSYEIMFPYYATHINTELARPRYAHNDLLNLIFEFGIGSVLFLMVLFNVFKTRKRELAILFTVCIVSLFTYPMHIPTPAFIAFLVAGYVISNNDTNGNIWTNRRSNLSNRVKGTKLYKA